MEEIKPTNKEPFTLVDKDYLQIKAIQELTKAIEKLRVAIQHGR